MVFAANPDTKEEDLEKARRYQNLRAFLTKPLTIITTHGAAAGGGVTVSVLR